MDEQDSVRARHQRVGLELLGPWMSSSREAPGPARDQALAETLEFAKSRSRWHAARLAGVNRLADAPVMTKADLMANWDDVCTDPRITLAAANAHLERTSTPEYLAGDVMIVASGGSSGERGVFAWGWDDMARAYAVFTRWMVGFAAADDAVRVMIGAAGAHHMTTALLHTFPPPGGTFVQLAAATPLDQLVRELNALRPTYVGAYASIAHALALEQQAGRLDIAPVGITATAEPLLPEARAAIRAAWGVEAMNIYGTSEVSVIAHGCGHSEAMHLNEDALIVEVEPDRILVTSLINRTLPLIRYEMTDEVIRLDEPCPCGSPLALIADVRGRSDDWLNYPNGIRVHPHGVRSVLTRYGSVAEYQVRQTPTGIDVDVRADGALDIDGIADDLAASLVASGLDQPIVHVRPVDHIDRIGIGKLKRFVPLGPPSTTE